MVEHRCMSYTTLIDAKTLAAKGFESGWVIVDVRHQLADAAYGERQYAEWHIAGAVFLHCDRDLSGPMTGQNGRHPLPDPVIFSERLGLSGIGLDTQVVVYDDAEGMFAGRLWWMLRWLGHEKVAVLDGGLKAWVAAGGLLSAQSSSPVPLSPYPFTSRGRVVTEAEILPLIGQADFPVIDARSPDRFRGENETMDPVGGHIPGAKNRFFRDNLAESGCFKTPAVLRAEWLAVLGNLLPEHVIHQCGSGVTACHNLLAMEVAGLSGSQLYAGSWSAWCADASRPVATGAT